MLVGLKVTSVVESPPGDGSGLKVTMGEEGGGLKVTMGEEGSGSVVTGAGGVVCTVVCGLVVDSGGWNVILGGGGGSVSGGGGGPSHTSPSRQHPPPTTQYSLGMC